MIRKLIIVVLALVGIATAIVGWIGYITPVYLPVTVNERLQGYFYTSEGLARFYWFYTDVPVRMIPSPSKRRMFVRRASDRAICARYAHSRPGAISSYAFLWQTILPPPGGTAPTMIMAGPRTPITAPITLFIAYPVFVVVRGQYRRRRHKPGHCTKCEYDLTGNASGVCPECGTPRKTDVVVVLRDGCLDGVYSSRGGTDGTVVVEFNGEAKNNSVVHREADRLRDIPEDVREMLAPELEFKRRADGSATE